MLDITAIILTKDEEANLPDCINSIKPFVKRIVVVDSYSSDRTTEIAQEMGAEVLCHEWENHSRQYQWGEKEAEIATQWTFRIDADERISLEAAEEIETILKENKPEVTGIIVRYTVEFMGKRLYHGGIYPFRKLLIYKTGCAHIEDRSMDEHIILDTGTAVELKNDSYHHDYKGLSAWIDKHNKYSDREAQDYYRNLETASENGAGLEKKAAFKRWFKFNVYYKLPTGMRAHLYFWYRYYLKCGFLDGKEGKIFCFMQAYWYRYLVDAKIYEHDSVEKKNLDCFRRHFAVVKLRWKKRYRNKSER